MAHRPHRQGPAHGNRLAARWRARKLLAPALIILALLPAARWASFRKLPQAAA